MVNTGYFSDSFTSCLAAYKIQVHEVTCNVGDVCSPNDVAAALAKDNYALICITQVDTSTAVLNDVATLVRRCFCLFSSFAPYVCVLSLIPNSR